MAAFWSNPTPFPGPAFQQAQAQIHPNNIAGLLEVILRDRHVKEAQQAHQLEGVSKGVADFMAQKRQDDIAQTLLDQASYDQGDPLARQLNESDAHPAEAWAAYEQLRQQQLKENLITEQIARQRALTARAGRVSGSGGDSGGIADPYIYVEGQKMRASPSEAAQYWQGGSGGSQGGETPWEKLIPVARGKADDKGEFTNSYGEAATGPMLQLMNTQGKKIVLPYDTYNAYMQSHGGGPAATQAAGQYKLPTAPSAPAQSPLIPQSPTSERVKVISPSGNVGTLPKDQVEEALRNGYRLAQ